MTGRTPIISLQLGGRHLWLSFLVVENLDESDQFILGRELDGNFDITIDLNEGLQISELRVLIRVFWCRRGYNKND